MNNRQSISKKLCCSGAVALIENDKGELVTAPSTSPENMCLTPECYKGAATIATTADMAMICELFTQLIQASEILGRDEGLRNEL